MSVGQRKNFESLWGIQLQTIGSCAAMLYHWAMPLQSLHDTHPADSTANLTAKIRDFNNVMFVNRLHYTVYLFLNNTIKWGKNTKKVWDTIHTHQL